MAKSYDMEHPRSLSIDKLSNIEKIKYNVNGCNKVEVEDLFKELRTKKYWRDLKWEEN